MKRKYFQKRKKSLSNQYRLRPDIIDGQEVLVKIFAPETHANVIKAVSRKRALAREIKKAKAKQVEAEKAKAKAEAINPEDLQ